MPKFVGPIFVGTFPITQRFGENPAYYARFGLAGHNGVDFGMPVGTIILAGVLGVISEVGNDPAGYGNYVKVQDPQQSLDLIFAHLSQVFDETIVGEVVQRDTPIGRSGNTGASTGPHLHFGVGDTDSGGMRLNRENGYYGWEDPMDNNKFIANFNGGLAGPRLSAPSTTPTGTTTPSVPVGPAPPPYKPTFKGQTVSYNGNNFRSDNGTTWIFQGSDAERAAFETAEKKRQLAEAQAKAVDAGVYLTKTNLVELFNDINKNASDFGLADATDVIIKGPYKATLYDRYRGEGNVIATFMGPGTFKTPGPRIGSVRAELVLPPAPPPLPQVPITPRETQTAPGGATPPAGAWTGQKAPTHKDIYNLIARLH